MLTKKCRSTTYLVIFWNEDYTEKINREVYPMYQYSFEDVTTLLKGKEETCNIYEGRYSKDRGKYIITGRAYIWDGCNWESHM